MTRSKQPKTPPEQFPKIFAESLVHVFQRRELTDGLARWAESDPGAFYQLLGRLMPAELHLIGSTAAGEPVDMRLAAQRVAFMLAKADSETRLLEGDPVAPAILDAAPPLPQETAVFEPETPQNDPKHEFSAQTHPEPPPPVRD